MVDSETLAMDGTAFLRGSGSYFICDIRNFHSNAAKSLQMELYRSLIDEKFTISSTIGRIRVSTIERGVMKLCPNFDHQG
jgi:hypothetical protein